jgi:hypothetical protein
MAGRALDRLEPARAVLQQLAERVFDASVQRALVQPLDVNDADEVAEQVSSEQAMGIDAITGMLIGKVGNRALRLGSRSIPVRTLLTVLVPVGRSVRLGARELNALASLVVKQLRAAGAPVDPRFVQRVTINAYLWPESDRDLVAFHAGAPARLAAQWATRPLAGAIEGRGERVSKAASRVMDADLPELRRRFEREVSAP